MRPMHKSGTRPEKLRKLSKRHHRYSLELSIPDDKGAARSQQRQYCEDVRTSLPPILQNGLEKVCHDHDHPRPSSCTVYCEDCASESCGACEGCVEDEVALEYEGKHI